MSTEPITTPDELRDELSEVASRARVGGLESGTPGEIVESVPDEDGQWSVADVLSGMMAGQYAHGACVEVFGYRLYNDTLSDELANVWRIHPPDGGAGIDAVNLDNFATASEVETYLTEGRRE